jgi:hypothetical protein
MNKLTKLTKHTLVIQYSGFYSPLNRYLTNVISTGRIEKLNSQFSSWEGLPSVSNNERLNDYNKEEILKELKIDKNTKPFTRKFQGKNWKVSVKYSIKKINCDIKTSSFVECFHTSLRKHCEKKSAWGLWQWITYCADNGHNDLLSAFWKCFYGAYEEISTNVVSKTFDIRIKENRVKADKIILELFESNIKDFYDNNSRNSPILDDNTRSQYYIMKALLSGLVQSGEFPNVSLSVWNHIYSIDV